MTEILEKLLNEKFAEQSKYYTIILCITLGVMALFNIWINYKINKRLSSFGSSLKKTEIKFSKYHLDQVEAYKTLYLYFYNYRASTKRLLYFGKKDADHQKYKVMIESWYKDYSILYKFFHQNRILFTTKMCEMIDANFLSFSRFTTKVLSDREDLLNFEEAHYGEIMLMYQDEYMEIEKIQSRARKLRDSTEYKEAGKKSYELILEIENEFRELIK